MEFRVIKNSCDLDSLSETNLGESYILFGSQGNIYEQDLSDGQPGFDFWKHFCESEGVAIESIGFVDVDDSNITKKEIKDLTAKFGKI